MASRLCKALLAALIGFGLGRLGSSTAPRKEEAFPPPVSGPPSLLALDSDRESASRFEEGLDQMDGTLTEKLTLLAAWNPEQAILLAKRHFEKTGNLDLLADVLRIRMASDARGVAVHYNTLTAEDRSAILPVLLKAAFKDNVHGVGEFILATDASSWPQNLKSEALEAWVGTDPKSAIAWIKTLPEMEGQTLTRSLGHLFEEAQGGIEELFSTFDDASWFSSNPLRHSSPFSKFENPEEAIALGKSLKDPEVRAFYLAAALSDLSATNPSRAMMMFD
ncbi:MAG: hypothetical protein AAF514_10260, partial [Verrucomicrobiota bacterium]